ncbi:hypothetical protein [Adlercreutzia caecimuris]|nr:hypothetical protein [Adlercreutzia caecimuris]
MTVMDETTNETTAATAAAPETAPKTAGRAQSGPVKSGVLGAAPGREA